MVTSTDSCRTVTISRSSSCALARSARALVRAWRRSASFCFSSSGGVSLFWRVVVSSWALVATGRADHCHWGHYRLGRGCRGLPGRRRWHWGRCRWCCCCGTAPHPAAADGRGPLELLDLFDLRLEQRPFVRRRAQSLAHSVLELLTDLLRVALLAVLAILSAVPPAAALALALSLSLLAGLPRLPGAA